MSVRIRVGAWRVHKWGEGEGPAEGKEEAYSLLSREPKAGLHPRTLG